MVIRGQSGDGNSAMLHWQLVPLGEQNCAIPKNPTGQVNEAEPETNDPAESMSLEGVIDIFCKGVDMEGIGANVCVERRPEVVIREGRLAEELVDGGRLGGLAEEATEGVEVASVGPE